MRTDEEKSTSHSPFNCQVPGTLFSHMNTLKLGGMQPVTSGHQGIRMRLEVRSNGVLSFFTWGRLRDDDII